MRFDSSVLTFALVSFLSINSAFGNADQDLKRALETREKETRELEFFLFGGGNENYDHSMTRPPTPRPTCNGYGCHPTSAPTTRAPVTDQPSETPSETPTHQCQVTVDISCVNDAGVNCKDIETPQGECKGDIDSLSFTFLGGKCSESANTQDDSCRDFLGGPSGRSSIACRTEDDVTVFNEDGVSIGDFITIPTTGSLSDKLLCDISSSSGQIRQTVEINTSGKADLYLKDVYGSLQVESCDDQSCLESVEVTYEIKNIHDLLMDVTELTRKVSFSGTLNGEVVQGEETKDLIDLVEDTSLEPGESTTAKEDGVIDFCIKGEYETSVVVEADPPEGAACNGADFYQIVTAPEGCRVDVEIDCVDEDGNDCDDIPPAAMKCNNREEISSINFIYLGGKCDQSLNTQDDGDCEDLNGGPSAIRDGRVLCFSVSDDDVVAPLFNEVVSIGQEITVPSSGTDPLPEKIICEISEGDEKKQRVTIVTEGGDKLESELFLKDIFGSLQVEGCGEKKCLVPVTYTYTLDNVGQDSMDITEVVRKRDGEPDKSFLDEIEDKTLEVGEEPRAIIEKDFLDTCVEGTTTTVISCTADPPKGETCNGESEYDITLNPGCRVDVEITCEDERGTACDEIPTPPLYCNSDGCVDTVSFTYVGEKCKTSEANCEDFNGGPSTSSTIVCSNQFNREVLRETVTVNDVVNIPGESNLSLSEILTCEIFNPEDDQKVQELEINVCEGLYLKEEYGSLRLEGCGENNCLVDVTYNYILENVGTSSMEITEVQRTSPNLTPNPNNLLDELPERNLLPGDDTVVPEKAVLDFCVPAEYCVDVNVEADPPVGGTCKSYDGYCILLDVSKSPSASPSESPSASPSASPSESPSASPSESPSASPSESPSESPSASPSESPSESPSASPSESPSESPSASPSESPSDQPSSTPCDVDVKVDCTTEVLDQLGKPLTDPSTGEPVVQDCGCAAVTRTKCIDRPNYMKFRFNGGTCYPQSDNIQNDDLFQCFDFQGGPPGDLDEEAYIRVTDIKGGAIVYYENTTKVGNDYEIRDPSGVGIDVEANMNVSIYSSAAASPETLLQTLVFHSSCSQNLFLKDRFGATQLVEFNNTEQGLNSCAKTLFYNVNVGSSVETTSDLTLRELSVIVNGQLTNYTPEVYNKTLASDGVLELDPINFTVDLAQVTDNSVFARVTAESVYGVTCTPGSDFDRFTTGLAQAPNLPTKSPTLIPTSTPVPTPDPEDTACELNAFIQCDVTNRAGFFECENIVIPTYSQCNTTGIPGELEFVYRGGDCDDTTVNPQNFECVGTTGNDEENEEVYILITSDTNNVLYRQVTKRGDTIDLRGVSQYMIVEISVPVPDPNGDGFLNRPSDTVLQTMNITTTCESSSELSLLNRFGAFELTEFTIAVEEGGESTTYVNAAFADVEIEYGVQLLAGTTIPATITNGDITFTTGGDSPAVEEFSPPFGSSGQSATLGSRRNSVIVLGTKQFTIELTNGIPPSQQYDLFVAGENVNGDFMCSATDTLSIDVTDGAGDSPCL